MRERYLSLSGILLSLSKGHTGRKNLKNDTETRHQKPPVRVCWADVGKGADYAENEQETPGRNVFFLKREKPGYLQRVMPEMPSFLQTEFPRSCH